MRKFVGVFFVLLIFVCVLTGCSSNDTASLADKNVAELEYIERNLVSILNKGIYGEYEKEVDDSTAEETEEEDDIAWDEVLEDTKKIESLIATTIVDLTALNVEASEIAKLSDGVNSMIIAANNKDEKAYLTELSNVYLLIPTYMENYKEDSEIIFKKRLKYYAISTLVAYNNDNMELAKNQSTELERIYSERMQDLSYVQNNEYNLNKLYILIQELKRAVEVEDSELVKSKYLLVTHEI